MALVAAAAAADDVERFELGGDVFLAGDRVDLTADGARATFLAGETVRQSAAVTGASHLAGRRVTAAASVGGNLYAAGMDVSVAGPVAGDATLAGYAVRVNAPVEGNIRLFAARAEVTAPLGGSALIAAERLRLDAPVSGDMALSAERVEFGAGARIGGSLRLYGDTADRLEIPADVIDPARIERFPDRPVAGLDRPMPRPNWAGLLGGYLAGVLVVALVAAFLAAVAPGPLAEMRRALLARPFGTLGWGFLTLSAVIGAGLVLALTLVGILLVPAALVLAVIGGFFGYVVASYSFGVGLMLAAGRSAPETLGRRALAALIGAAVAGLIALIPFLGWLFVLALVLAGVGAITLRAFRPAFFAT